MGRGRSRARRSGKRGVRPRVRADWRRVEPDQKGWTGRFTVFSSVFGAKSRMEEGSSNDDMEDTCEGCFVSIYRFSEIWIVDRMPQTGDSDGGMNSLGTDFLESFMLSPCYIVSMLSNRHYHSGVFKYIDSAYTL